MNETLWLGTYRNSKVLNIDSILIQFIFRLQTHNYELGLIYVIIVFILLTYKTAH